LVEDTLDLIHAHQTPLLPVKQGEHIQSLLLSAPAEEPLLGDQINDLAQREALLVLVGSSYLVLYLLAIHLGVGEVAQNAAKVLTVDVPTIATVVERKCVFDLVLLG